MCRKLERSLLSKVVQQRSGWSLRNSWSSFSQMIDDFGLVATWWASGFGGGRVCGFLSVLLYVLDPQRAVSTLGCGWAVLLFELQSSGLPLVGLQSLALLCPWPFRLSLGSEQSSLHLHHLFKIPQKFMQTISHHKWNANVYIILQKGEVLYFTLLY